MRINHLNKQVSTILNLTALIAVWSCWPLTQLQYAQSAICPGTNKSVAHVKNSTMRNQFRMVTWGNRCRRPGSPTDFLWRDLKSLNWYTVIHLYTCGTGDNSMPAWCESYGKWKLQSPWSGNISFPALFFPIVGQVDPWVQLMVFVILSGGNTCFPYRSHALCYHCLTPPLPLSLCPPFVFSIEISACCKIHVISRRETWFHINCFPFTPGGFFFAKPMRENKYVTMIDPFQQKYGNFLSSAMILPALVADVLWVARTLVSLGKLPLTVKMFGTTMCAHTYLWNRAGT